MLAAVTRRFRVPLLWVPLPAPRQQRDRGPHRAAAALPRAFPVSTIRILLADREFIGAEWLKFLNDNNIPFAIRLRENLRVTDRGRHELTLFARLRLAAAPRTFTARLGTRDAAEAGDAPLLNFAAKRL